MITLRHPDHFVRRHIGPTVQAQKALLETTGCDSLEELIAQTIPEGIRLKRPLALPPPKSEWEVLALAHRLGQKNQVFRSLLGLGYSEAITPPVILRNIMQNPGWYTQYTPYQAEISQGRLEALLNFQTMVCDLTALPVANASLLDEATAAAEAMALCHGYRGSESKRTFLADARCHPQTLEVLRTRAEGLGWTLLVADVSDPEVANSLENVFGALVQYPDTRGTLRDYRAFAEKVHTAGALVVAATDLLALTLLVPPGEWGADMAVGNSQRFGVPLGYGGPHAAFLSVKEDFVRKMPGRIIGVSKDAQGNRAYRMALQTREQHIRREKATSNICTAQALLAIMAGMYAVYHGPEGLRLIAKRVHGAACVLALGLEKLGVQVTPDFFDTLEIHAQTPEVAAKWIAAAHAKQINLRALGTRVIVALDEITDELELATLLEIFGAAPSDPAFVIDTLAEAAELRVPAALERTSRYLEHPVWHSHRSETEMLRYIRTLESRDLSLCHAMIPLGSCTMKLNGTAEMMPVTDPEWNRLHPYCPVDQAQGYAQVFAELEAALAEVTGFAGVSLQPNAGAQGEYAGLLAIRKYHESRGEAHRKVCLIPQSAHGTNPASAVMAGLEVVVVAVDSQGNVDADDLEKKAAAHADKLAGLMLTYPSTHGVFEPDVLRLTRAVHQHGGQVYMDGANMNAQVGLTRPADLGADVCHLNLHKTFCIPHGGGGPGMGPIAVAEHLVPFLPRAPRVDAEGAAPKGDKIEVGPVSAAPYSSASILLISWAYIHLMGAVGLTEATEVAILNANYIAARLAPHYPVVYRGANGRVAHECIIDLRGFKKTAGIEVEDVAKRLIDYGFHAPTMSFPIPGTLMIEPTESESGAELDRFCQAMIMIREEIRAIEEGRLPKDDNPLKHAPHTLVRVTQEEWNHPYSRQLAAYPAPWTKERKFFPVVGRLYNAYGDRNLVCTCPDISEYAAE